MKITRPLATLVLAYSAALAAFSWTVAFAIAQTAPGPWSHYFWAILLSAVLYFCMTVDATKKLVAQTRRFPGRVLRLILIHGRWLLIPLGMLVGGHFFSDHFRVSPVWGWAVAGWVIFPFVLPHLPRFLKDLLDAFLSPPDNPRYLRGTALLTINQAIRRTRALRVAADEPRLCFGGLPLPEQHSSTHFSIVGPTGSGKTVTLRLLMQSILTQIDRGSDWRAFIYDPKNEFFPILSGMPLKCPVKTLHPYDKRSVAWHIARDIDNRSAARTLTETLIPDPGGQNTFFYQAAQAIFAAVIEALILYAPDKWTLRDVLLVISDSQMIARLLQGRDETYETYRSYFELRNSRTLQEILVTLQAHVDKLRPVAALWSHAEELVSLKDWAKDSYILLITKDPEIAAPLDNINRVLFQKLAQIFTKQGTGRSWIFIDEAKFAGKIPDLNHLLTTGRSFGARVCFAVQDLSGLRNTYGDNLALELLGSTGNKAILGSWDPESAKYLARVMGRTERFDEERTETTGNYNQASTSIARRRVEVDAVMPDEFMQLYPANRRHFYGYYAVPAVGRYKGWLAHSDALYPFGTAPNLDPRPPDQQYYSPWNERDRERLGEKLFSILAPETKTNRSQPSTNYLNDVNLPIPGSSRTA